MSLTEHKTRPAIRRWVKAGNGYAWKVNDNYEDGVPDWFLEFADHDIFMECKHVKALPVRADVKLALSSPQIAWLGRRHTLRQDARVMLTIGVTKIEHIAIFYSPDEWASPISLDTMRQRLLPANAKSFLDNLKVRQCS
jgi:hypothetical protein